MLAGQSHFPSSRCALLTLVPIHNVTCPCTIHEQLCAHLNIHWKDWCWSSNTWATWCKELSHWKRPYAGKDWGQEKGVTENEIVGWHHWLDGHEFEQTQGDSEGQGSLACCSPWGRSQTGLCDWSTMCPPDGGSREQWPQPATEAHSRLLEQGRLNVETNSSGSNPYLSTLGDDEFQRQLAKQFLMYVDYGHRVRHAWKRGQFLPVSLSGPPCLLQGPELPWDQNCESTYSMCLWNYYLHIAEY